MTLAVGQHGGKGPAMTEFVCRRTGRTYQVGEQLDDDGHAVIHAVMATGPDLALKQYLPATLQKRPDLEARIKAMIAKPPAYRPDRSGPVIAAWPEDAVYVSGRFAGYVMPRVDARAAATVPDVAARSTTSFRDRVAVAENLTRAVAVLHDDDVVIGDFRRWNLLAWGDGRVTLLGCDRMQVVDPESGRRFPCVAGRDACTPPELQMSAGLSGTLRTSSSDVFTLALHLHQILLQGAHPFQGQWRGGGVAPPEHVLAQNGLWSHGGDPRLAAQPGAPLLRVLPATLQQYFRAALADGARNPDARPPARDWLTELVALRESLVPCPREASHSYGRHLPSCPWCPPQVGSRSGTASPSHRPVGRPAPTPRPAVNAAAPVDTVALGNRDAVDVARTRPAGPTRPDRDGRSAVPHAEPAPPRRHRSGLRLAAWAGAAVVLVGGLVSVSTGADRSAPRVADPTISAQTYVASTPLPPDRADDPIEALEQVRSQDAPAVEALAESWVAQLSARPARTQSADRSITDAAVLAGHDTLRRQHPAALLLRSTDWNYDGEFWITVVNERFPTADDANTWCDAHRFAPQDCFAKRLSRSGVVEGSARYRS